MKRNLVPLLTIRGISWIVEISPPKRSEWHQKPLKFPSRDRIKALAQEHLEPDEKRKQHGFFQWKVVNPLILVVEVFPETPAREMLALCTAIEKETCPG